MFWIIAAVIAALVMLVLMSKRAKEEDDPVWLTVLEVERLANEIARWETNLWSLWAMAIIENLLFRLDKLSDRTLYLGKLTTQLLELEIETWEARSKSENQEISVDYLSRIDDLMTP